MCLALSSKPSLCLKGNDRCYAYADIRLLLHLHYKTSLNNVKSHCMKMLIEVSTSFKGSLARSGVLVQSLPTLE